QEFDAGAVKPLVVLDNEQERVEVGEAHQNGVNGLEQTKPALGRIEDVPGGTGVGIEVHVQGRGVEGGIKAERHHAGREAGGALGGSILGQAAEQMAEQGGDEKVGNGLG